MSPGSAISRRIVLAWRFNLAARASKALNWLPSPGFDADCGSMTSSIGLSIGQGASSSRLGALPVSGQSTQPASKTVDTRAKRMNWTLFADESKNQQAEKPIESGVRSHTSEASIVHCRSSARCDPEDAGGSHMTWARPDCGNVVKREVSR